jgi:GDPmannose 4,6-dehydratase
MKAFITGITGQDGSWLAEFLLDKGYEVHGLVRRLSKPNYENITHIKNDVILHTGDLTDTASLSTAAKKVKPDEVYNLASQSFVGASWDSPIATTDVTGLGALRVLEAFIRDNDCKFYQASSSEMFGNSTGIINEDTPLRPRSPYGCAKVLAHNLTTNYRESYDIFAVSGVLFNHESERRGLEFVTRKITDAVAQIKKGKLDKLELGNIDAKRDWGYAKDYVEAMWLMLQQDTPEDMVIATGKTHSVKDFCEKAFKRVGLDWKEYTVYNKDEHLRPAELDWLKGDSTKAKMLLNWEPSTNFNDLVNLMVDADLKRWDV